LAPGISAVLNRPQQGGRPAGAALRRWSDCRVASARRLQVAPIIISLEYPFGGATLFVRITSERTSHAWEPAGSRWRVFACCGPEGDFLFAHEAQAGCRRQATRVWGAIERSHQRSPRYLLSGILIRIAVSPAGVTRYRCRVIGRGSSTSQPFFSSFAIVISPGGIVVLCRTAWRMTRSL